MSGVISKAKLAPFFYKVRKGSRASERVRERVKRKIPVMLNRRKNKMKGKAERYGLEQKECCSDK